MSKKPKLEFADESERLIVEAALKAYRQCRQDLDHAAYGHGMEVLETSLMTHGRESLRVMGEQLAKAKREKKR